MRLLDGYWNLRIYGKRLGLTIPQQPYRILTTAVLLGHQYQAVVNDQGEEVLLCLWYKKDPKGNSVYVANWTLVTDPHVVEAVYTHLSDGSDTLWLDLQNTPIVDDYFASSRPELRIRRLPTPNIIWWMAEDPIFEDPQFSQMRLPRLVMRQDRRQASRAEVVTSPEPVVPPTRSKEDDPTSWELLVEDSVE